MYCLVYSAYKKMLENRMYPRRHEAQQVFHWMDRRYGEMKLSVLDRLIYM